MKVAKTFRLDPGLVERAQERARAEHGGNLTAVVDLGLRRLLGVAEEGSGAGSGVAHGEGRSVGGSAAASDPSPAPAPPEPRLDVAKWLQGRTGIPLALLQRFVRSGRVEVDGAVCRDQVLPKSRLVNVRLDGHPVE